VIRSRHAAGAYTPLDGTRFTARDLADPAREVPNGERGTLFVSGPQFEPVPGGGTLRPAGAAGLIDAAGNVVVISPLEELVVAAGYMIYPSRIEAALMEHEGLAEAAVIGIRDGKRGTAPYAFVVLKRGVVMTERDIVKHLASRISKIEMPADIEFCSQLPQDAFGAVDKNALRARRGV